MVSYLIPQPSDTYQFIARPEDDFKVIDNVFELGAGGGFVVNYQGGAFDLAWDGPVRAVKLPTGDFLIDETFRFGLPQGDLEIGLKSVLAGLGVNLDDTLFQIGDKNEFKLSWPNGDLVLVIGDPVRLELRKIDVTILGQDLLTVTSSVSEDARLAFEGVFNGVDFDLGDLNFGFEPSEGGDFSIVFSNLNQDVPDLDIALPAVTLVSNIPQWPEDGIDLGSFDFAGDLGFEVCIPLPSIDFDGISLDAGVGGEKGVNFVRFSGSLIGLELEFEVSAQIPFTDQEIEVIDIFDPFGPKKVVKCAPHIITFQINSLGQIGGSFAGDFCLGLDLELGYNPDDPDGCQFFFDTDLFTIKFGTECIPGQLTF